MPRHQDEDGEAVVQKPLTWDSYFPCRQLNGALALGVLKTKVLLSFSGPVRILQTQSQPGTEPGSEILSFKRAYMPQFWTETLNFF